ncbi:MAG TPA: GntR family transcriptional regulator [Roseiarcus sp.]|nr:GntR family transcriptional regulator [Roseiarcus sp.]
MQADAKPLYEIIYSVLREHLIDGSFPPGLVLGETGVARAFKSSRIPAAAALQRLSNEGLIKKSPGKGYLALDADPGAVVRRELEDAGLRLPETMSGSLKTLNQARIYPAVEHAVAASLSYGRFMVNESALAEHFGVSRTVAHEVLTRLERSGLIEKVANQRWYAGPLTVDRLREHFEMRWLLEPAALGQAADALSPAALRVKRKRVERARRRRNSPAGLERLEVDLHGDVVLSCANRQLRDAIQRNALPLIATHSTFALIQEDEEIETMLAEHLTIYDCLLAGEKRAAMNALEAHIRRSLEPNIERLTRIGAMPDALRPPFLMPVPSVGR